MSTSLSVKKWGGENAAELVKSPNNVCLDSSNGLKQVIVVSAIRSNYFNTTDKLIKIGELIKSRCNFGEIETELILIRDFHFSIIDEKISGDTKNLKEYINQLFEKLLSDIHYSYQNQDKTPNKENDYSIVTTNGFRSIIGFGEELSAYIHEKVITFTGLDTKFIDLNGVVPENSSTLKESEIFHILNLFLNKKGV